jgi:hypothetical protein
VKSVLAVVILTLTLAVSASAGQIQTPGAVSSGGGTTPVSTSVIVALVSLIYG